MDKLSYGNAILKIGKYFEKMATTFHRVKNEFFFNAKGLIFMRLDLLAYTRTIVGNIEKLERSKKITCRVEV